VPVIVFDHGFMGFTKHGPALALRNRLCFLGCLFLVQVQEHNTGWRRKIYLHVGHDDALLEFLAQVKDELGRCFIGLVTADSGLATSVKSRVGIFVFNPRLGAFGKYEVAKIDRQVKRKILQTELVEDLVDAVKRHVANLRGKILLTSPSAVYRLVESAECAGAPIRFIKVIPRADLVITFDLYRKKAQVDYVRTVGENGKIVRQRQIMHMDECLTYFF